MQHRFHWEFPLTRTHTGMLLGNGVLGAMVWGEQDTLRITVARADFWDHRGGIPWKEGIRYQALREMLAQGDSSGLRKLFEPDATLPGEPLRPSVLPVGRFELLLPEGDHLESGMLQTDTGVIHLALRGAEGTPYTWTLTMDMESPSLGVQHPPIKGPREIRRIPAWEYVGDRLRSISFTPPELFEKNQLLGWIQSRPADPALCVGCATGDGEVWISALYGKDSTEARANIEQLLTSATERGFAAHNEANHRWWRAYWADVPELVLPNARLQFLFEYGMYKFAGLTHPQGVPATLQGPWIEEYQMPPWQSDYHFNINAQMCYWPAYRGNRLSHLKPFFALIESWMPILRENARRFIGAEEGLIVPHAVDDRGTGMGGFWTGAIDHGCTAWIAQMMHEYWRFTQDDAFLKDTAWPFLKGAMEVYERMLEKSDGVWELPLSVSPEYRGAATDAWGRNASFQLAAIHYLLEALLEAAPVVGETPKMIWKELQSDLPRATLFDRAEFGRRSEGEIALWEGTPLEESHRHHSHLAGLFPFDILDPDAAEWRPVIERTFASWVEKGMGLWSGWCVPWAAILHAHRDNGDMAEMLLEIWQKVYTNEGHGTLHDACFPGFTLISSGEMAPGEIMQIEAGMGAATATMEMLLHSRRGVHHVMSGIPRSWKDVSFRGIRAAGGVLVDACKAGGRLESVTLRAEKSCRFRLRNPWGGAKLRCVGSHEGEKAINLEGELLELELRAGEKLTLNP